MSPTFYHVIHVVSIILMTGYIFRAFTNPAPSEKKINMIATHTLAMLALIGGFGLLAKLKYGFPGWVIVKVLCWIGLVALASMVYKKKHLTGLFSLITIVIVIIAVIMVYVRPF